MSDTANSVHGQPSWIEHNGAEAANARKFYEDVLGWETTDMPMQDGGNYTMINVGEKPIGGFSPQPAEGGWLIYITVDDVDARFNLAISKGAKSVSDPFDAPGVGRMATIEDPFGAKLAFIKYA